MGVELNLYRSRIGIFRSWTRLAAVDVSRSTNRTKNSIGNGFEVVVHVGVLFLASTIVFLPQATGFTDKYGSNTDLRVGCELEFHMNVCCVLVTLLLCTLDFNRSIRNVGALAFVNILLLMAGVESNPGPKEDIGSQHDAVPDHPSGATPEIQVQLLNTLGLAERYDDKISIKEVIEIDVSMHTDDKPDLMSMPWVLLKRIISVDANARDNILSGQVTHTAVECFEDALPIDLFYDTGNTNIGLSSLDIFVAVYQCCDPFLKQLLFQKMYMCKIAVPFVNIEIHSQRPRLSVWPLRTLLVNQPVEHSVTPNSLQFKVDRTVLDMQTKVVAFARFGRPQLSKSELLNGILSVENYNTFHNVTCRSGTVTRQISNGYVEIFWLPSSDHHTVLHEDITFLNMRGSLEYDFPLEYIKNINCLSDGMFVVAEIEHLLKHKLTFQNILTQFKCVTLVFASHIRAKDQNIKELLGHLNEACKLSNTQLFIVRTYESGKKLNKVDIVSKLVDVISKKVSTCYTSLGERIEKINDTFYISDEENDDSVNGKHDANALVAEMKSCKNRSDDEPTTCWKRTITPASYVYADELRDLTVKAHKKSHDIEFETLTTQLRDIRIKQIKNTSCSVRMFTNLLIQNHACSQRGQYFLTWLKLLLEKEITADLITLNRKKLEAEGKITALSSEEDEGSLDAIEKQKQIVIKLEKEIDHSSFGIEYMFREVAHVCDALLELDLDHGEASLPPLPDIASVFVDHLLSGLSLEIVDGDHLFMAKRWIEKVFKCAHERFESNQKKVLCLSVLGLQSSGKSTLLNTMFGLHFSVSSGRCTKGVHTQLLPIKKYKKQVLPFHYIMVVDSEGLRAPELTDIEVSTKNIHDNMLATFVTGIADLTLINVMGENFAEIQDILQIVVHALLKMKSANNKLHLRQSCMFLHHNVTDKSARDNMKDGMVKVMNVLDKVTEYSSLTTDMSDVTQFKDVIKFDINSNVYHLPNLWQGTFPMNRVNTDYSRGVMEMKRDILERTITAQNKCLKDLPEIANQAKDLWVSVLNEDYLFAFKSGVEVRAYNNLQTKVSKLKLELESYARETLLVTYRKRIQRLENKDALEKTKSDINTEILTALVTKQEHGIENIEAIFTESEDAGVIIKWKSRFTLHLQEYCSKLEADLKRETNNYCEMALKKMMVSSVTAKHIEQLLKKKL